MLTKKQKEFADEYLETGNGTQAALKAYDIETKKKEECAASIGYENLRKPQIQAYIENEAEGAASRIVEISKTAKMEAVKLNANKDILDRAGFKPTDKTDNTVRVITASEDETITSTNTDTEGQPQI